MSHRVFRLSRTDLALSVLSGIIEAALLGAIVYRKWFRV